LDTQGIGLALVGAKVKHDTQMQMDSIEESEACENAGRAGWHGAAGRRRATGGRGCVLLAGLSALLLALQVAEGGTVGSAAEAGENWPRFRGPNGDGHARGHNLPAKWSETENIIWKTAVHGVGWSSPVIWGKQIWLTTAQPDGHQLFAVCIDRETGKVLQDIKVFEVEKPARLPPDNSYASPTGVIEAGRVFVHYGTYGTACLDTASGQVLWSRRDIKCDHQVGAGASLAGAGDLLFLSNDGLDQQYVMALDKASGQTVWKTARSTDFAGMAPEDRKAFATPAIVEAAGGRQVVSTGAHAVMGYDAATGRELWKVRFKGYSIVPSPVCGLGMAFVSTGFDPTQIWAVRLGGQGDVTDTHVAWRVTSHTPTISSPVLVEDCLYFVNDVGVISCIEAQTGQVVWDERVAGNCSASPLYAEGRIYFCARNGATVVLTPGRTCRILGTNQLDGMVMASPAVADNAIFLRSKTDLYRIGDGAAR
jgi:outer membrane protein assembly factor BamB